MKLQNLKNIREDHDIRQKTLADHLGVSQNTYSQYENGTISISPEMLIKLGDYFDNPKCFAILSHTSSLVSIPFSSRTTVKKPLLANSS